MEDYTYDDYIEWDGRWELIAGSPIPVPPVQTKKQQELILKAMMELEDKIKECDLCLIVGSADWKIENDTVVRPAICVICDEPNGAYITKPPKLIIEIVDSQERKDFYENIKFDLYKNSEVRYYIIFYPEENMAEAFKLVDGEFKKCGRFSSQEYNFEIDRCGLSIDFGKIFS